MLKALSRLGGASIVFAIFAATAAGCAGSEEADVGASGGSSGTDGGKDSGSDSASDASDGAVNGRACKTSAECASGHCVDAICCDSACDGDCRSCSVVGKEGTCSLVAAGIDPDGDCGDPKEACSGTCDGAGACAYPGAEKLCGTTACKDGAQTGSACDGNGVCQPVETSCGFYQCFGSACLSTCAGDTDCTSNAYCSSGICAEKKANGKSCTDANQCVSDVCSQSVCCNVSCDAPSDCSSGQCLCNGTACKTGEKCITWYADFDKDGYGNAASTKLGCESTGPTDGLTYSKNKDDCYDSNADAKPGQTAYFTIDRGDSSYDYDCNTVAELQYANVATLQCGDCGLKVGSICYSCGAVSGVNTFGFGCNGSNLCSIGGATTGFKDNVACGASSTLYGCAQCSATILNLGSKAQGCH